MDASAELGINYDALRIGFGRVCEKLFLFLRDRYSYTSAEILDLSW
jgi:hypothetical protein